MADRPARHPRWIRETFLALPGVATGNIGGFISHRMDEALSGVRSAMRRRDFRPRSQRTAPPW